MAGADDMAGALIVATVVFAAAVDHAAVLLHFHLR